MRKYLIDTNAVITPAKQYYPMDLMPKYWDSLKRMFEEKSVNLLDMIYNEIVSGNDEVSDWLKSIEDTIDIIDHRESDILQSYSNVLEYVSNCGFYKESALAEWSRSTVADPWLIATAKARNLVIVSLETSNTGLNQNNRSKMAKIPDVAKALGVEHCNVFEMVRELRLLS